MKKVLFIDRDGTLSLEPSDEQLDSFEKLKFYPGAITWLSKIANEFNYELAMITNQDGMGTSSFPENTFWPVQNFILDTLENEGIRFTDIYIDRSFAANPLPTRKPGTGLLKKYFSGNYDLKNSFVIGDRYTDIELAKNLGAQGILIQYDQRKLGEGETKSSENELDQYVAFSTSSWKNVYEFLFDQDRKSKVVRNTNETKIAIEIDLNGRGKAQISTGIGFFDHMLDQISRHGGVDLTVNTHGDLHIDEHHTIEDTALALGEAFKNALGKKIGTERYGFQLPMDDCEASCSIDFGGRPWLVWDADFKREKVGDVSTELFHHFFKSFSDTAQCNLNIKATGENEHHKIEAIFKAFARAIKMAIRKNKGDSSLPSTKGTL
ncbi:MAG: bifunctional histidinol-phosphatase/imidazoleglycerol-phosphate dehydratase HisB [Cyclobacteriaceae bacterium]|nr:bifunctional histidinol-phosphatase/imidazoleglycerol-phosphate dehydratase HisB [Cyclobacteriaceae bacterium]